MAAVAGLVAMLKGPGRVWCVFAGLRKNPCASGAVTPWRRECSSQSQQVPSKADMPVAMENPYKEPPKKCILCGTTLDYKNVQECWKGFQEFVQKIQSGWFLEKPSIDHIHVIQHVKKLLSQFISPYTGKILGRHITGLCEKKQSELTKTIKRARKAGFMSVTYKDPTFLSDPKICNIKYPE